MKNVQLYIIIFLVDSVLFFSSCTSQNHQQETEVLHIGALLPLTGDAAVLGKEVQQAIQLAADRYNAGNDNHIKVYFEDTRCSGKDAVSGLQKLMSINDVQALIGPLCSSATLAVAPIAEQNAILLLSPASTNPTISDAGDYIFRVIPSDALQGKVGAELVYNQGMRNGAVIYLNNDYGVGLKNVFVDTFTALDGNIVAEEAYEVGAADFKTQITKIKQKDPSFVYIVALPGEGGQLLKQLRELQIAVPLFGAEGIKDPSVIEVAGNAAEGLIITFPQQTNSPERKTFFSAYKKLHGAEPGTFAPEGYDTFNIIAMAYEINGGSRTKMKDALYAIKDFPGTSGIITFDAKGDVNKPYVALVVKNGEFVAFESE